MASRDASHRLVIASDCLLGMEATSLAPSVIAGSFHDIVPRGAVGPRSLLTMQTANVRERNRRAPSWRSVAGVTGRRARCAPRCRWLRIHLPAALGATDSVAIFGPE